MGTETWGLTGQPFSQLIVLQLFAYYPFIYFATYDRPSDSFNNAFLWQLPVKTGVSVATPGHNRYFLEPNFSITDILELKEKAKETPKERKLPCEDIGNSLYSHQLICV
ncbi:hypothetical protein VNO77_00229 [Canavalia gladiata]|uniref:Uncharacterized protein n=1 Tax=Canavalia gladiata TaxID=3824 RepID=A0AAN9MPN3_CANGL